MPSLKGRILIASPRLADPNFQRTIVLMVRDDDEEGSLGLVLNRPLSVSVKEACEDALEAACNVESPLHQGGPCEGPLMVIHTDETVGEMQVAPGLYFTSDKDGVEELLADGDQKLKCFIGYAGWGRGQLEGELDEGAWLSCPATPELVFDEISHEWSKLLTHLTYGAKLPLDRIPDDPTVN
jgi:putative transcriptional regulator